MNEYQMGIAWGIGGFAEGRFILRHEDKYFLEQMKLPNKIYHQITGKGKLQYVVKSETITPDDLPGWSPRNSSERDIPILKDYHDFVRAYIELHTCLDYCLSHSTRDGKIYKYKRFRMRIYGNDILIQSINNLLHENCGANLKSPQKTPNQTTKHIAYTSLDELTDIFNWIDDTPRFEPFWQDVNQKLHHPKIKK